MNYNIVSTDEVGERAGLGHWMNIEKRRERKVQVGRSFEP